MPPVGFGVGPAGRANGASVSRRAALVAGGLILAGALGQPSAAGDPRPPPEPPRTGEVSVRVVYPDRAPASGASVSLGGNRVETGRGGTVRAPGIPVTSGVVSADAVRSEGGILGLFGRKVRYRGFTALSPGAGTPLDVLVSLSPVLDRDRECRACHPDRQNPGPGVPRCAHKSGVRVKQAQRDRVAEFNRENEAARRAGRIAYPSIFLEEKEIGGETAAVLVCESCHTNHIATGIRAYVTMPFQEKSVLCRGCHV